MNIIIKTKNLELTESLRDYIVKRIDGLNKFIEASQELTLEVEKESLHHKHGQVFRTEAILHLSKKHLVAEARGEDLGKTITQVRDELKEEIKKYKTKHIELPRRQAKKTSKETRAL